MKTRIVMIGSVLIASGMMTFQAMGQRAENDDMYFNSKDREKLKTETAIVSANDKIDADYKAFKKKHFDENEEETTSTVNPTDSYSARTINPEYISRSNSEQASEDEQNYYVEGYAAPTNTYDSYSSNNYNNYNNNNANYGYGNSYGNYGYGSTYNPYNSWYSPYYGNCNPYASPYYGGTSGWSLSFSYMWGNSGYGSYYNPYSYYPYSYTPYYSNGYPTYYYGGSESSSVNYGKRPSRHSAVVTPTPRSRERVSSNTSGTTNGRSRQPDEYYVKPFRRTSTNNSSTSETRDRYAMPSSTDNSTPATRTRDSNTTRPAYTPAPTRSSGGSGGSAPTRSSGGSSSSSGSRSRH